MDGHQVPGNYIGPNYNIVPKLEGIIILGDSRILNSPPFGGDQPAGKGRYNLPRSMVSFGSTPHPVTVANEGL